LTDVALMRLKGKVENLPVAKLGDSDAMRVGDGVLAIGNPFGLTSSVSSGIISARARQIRIAGPYDDFLQTDAAINPGNSGGPLFNMRGEVIGMNTAIVGGGTGIGFAVPSNLAKALLPQLEKEGQVTRGWLGIEIQDLTPELAKGLSVNASDGAIVVGVNDGSPAKKAGLQPDDIIIALDGQKITSGNVLTRTVAMKRPGSSSNLTVLRGGKQQEVKVLLGTRPDLEGKSIRRGTEQSPDEEDGEKQKIGMRFQDVDPRLVQGAGLPPQGALITEVQPGSAAERAELQPGMVVVEAGRKPVQSANDLLKAIRRTKSGSSLLLRVQMPGAAGRYFRTLNIP
jgi:serine protease Do